MCRCGTLVYGLAGMVVLGEWLDLMILEVFSNLWLYDNGVPYTYELSSNADSWNILSCIVTERLQSNKVVMTLYYFSYIKNKNLKFIILTLYHKNFLSM